MPNAVRPCRAPGSDPDLWFSTAPARQAEAAALCFTCPFQVQCAEAGKEEEWGIWGGVLPSDPSRRALIRRARMAALQAERLELVAVVCEMTAEGKSKSVIAAELGLSVPTISRLRAAA